MMINKDLKNNRYFRSGITLCLISLILNLLPFDFLQGMCIGLSITFILFGIFDSQGKFEKFKLRKRVLLQRLF